jgi:hypothetical protein
MTMMDVEGGWSKSDVCDCLERNHGQLLATCSELKIHRATLNRYLHKYPDLWDLVYKLRKEHTKVMKTMRVEKVLNMLDGLCNRKDLKEGYQISLLKYTLDNLGKEEGFGNLTSDKEDENSAPKDKDIDLHHENMLLRNKIAQLEANGNKSEARQELCGGDTQV